MILEKIKEANDVKQLSLSECEQLAQEIRDFLIRSLSETGGHLASNLGVVELTIALHRFLHFYFDICRTGASAGERPERGELSGCFCDR